MSNDDHLPRQSRRALFRAIVLTGASAAFGYSQAAVRKRSGDTPPVVVLAQIDFDSIATMQEAIKLARHVASSTQKESGCLHYAYGVDINKPTRLQLSEWWRDEAALNSHLRSLHLREFRKGLRRLGGSTAKVTRFSVGHISDLRLPPLDP